MSRRWILEAALPAVLSAALLATLGAIFGGRLAYPFDLEWMEGGMLAHAHQLLQGRPLYGPPSVDFVPYIYPPGYPALLAALSPLFGLSMALGRVVSVISIAAAAAAIVFRIVRISGRPEVALGAGALFLGTYPHAGAFYDLVRADSLGIALLGWSLVLGAERGKKAAIGSGLLLAASFLVKRSAALFGLPILLGLSLRSRREASWFALCSLGPALLATAALQVSTDGAFLVWMIDVASAHPMAWGRLPAEIPREWGSALPIAWVVLSLWALLGSMRLQSVISPMVLSLSIVLPAAVWAGFGLASMDASQTIAQIAAGTGYIAMIVLPMSLAALAIGWWIERRSQGAARPSWEPVYEVAVLLTALASALVMRLHDSGFVNVHTPLFFCASAAFGTVLTRARALRLPAAFASLVLSAQLLWSLAPLVQQRRALVPTEADEAAGWRFVEAIRAADGPVLSPFAAWMPVYAGLPPSLHAMGVWDCDFADGPYRSDLAVIERALAEHRWALILGGPHPLLGKLSEHYRVSEEILAPDDPRLMPKTGYLTRPMRLWVPK